MKFIAKATAVTAATTVGAISFAFPSQAAEQRLVNHRRIVATADAVLIYVDPTTCIRRGGSPVSGSSCTLK